MHDMWRDVRKQEIAHIVMIILILIQRGWNDNI